MTKYGIPSENILAIIIGVKEYNQEGLNTLEAADNNANEFRKTLRERKYGAEVTPEGKINIGVPADNIFKRTDGAVKSHELKVEIVNWLNKRNNDRINLIIFYYSGHGYFDTDKSQYYLTVKETDKKFIRDTALNMADIGDVFADTKKNVVFILDSCFSASAFESVSLRSNFYIMASSDYNKTTKYPENEYLSPFTAAFIDTARNGISSFEGDLSFNAIFDEIKNKLEAKNFPCPQKIDKNETGNIIFEQNNSQGQVIQFNLDDAITKIYNSFYPNQTTTRPLSKIVMESFPTTISVYIRNLFSDNKLLNDHSFLQDFYYQVIHFLSFLFINDLTRPAFVEGKNTDNNSLVGQTNIEKTKTVLTEEDLKFFNSWKKTKTSDNDINHFYIQVIKRSCTEYKNELFIEELRKKNNLLTVIERMESCFNQNRDLITDKFADFRRYLFTLLSELKFLKEYDLITVKFIEVKKSFYGRIVYEHAVSSLLGPDPAPYQTSPVLESEKDFLNNAIIFIPKILIKQHLTALIAEHKFLNLWPFIIDGNGNDTNAQIPTLCVFEDITEELDVKQYNYRPVQYKKEREQKREYSALRAYPGKEEWDYFYKS
jgi:hypothetical protein